MTELKSVPTPKPEAHEPYVLVAICRVTNDMIVSDIPAEIGVFAAEHNVIEVTRWEISGRHVD